MKLPLPSSLNPLPPHNFFHIYENNIFKLKDIMQNIKMDYFNLAIPSATELNISRNSSFENVVAQLQKFTVKVLCVVDNSILKYFDINTIPSYFHDKLRFDYKSTKNGITEYYFRSIDGTTLYCFFNYAYAKLAYPRLDDFISSISNSSVNVFDTEKSKSSPAIEYAQETISITDLNITDRKNTYYFNNYNYPIISTRRTFI